MENNFQPYLLSLIWLTLLHPSELLDNEFCNLAYIRTDWISRYINWNLFFSGKQHLEMPISYSCWWYVAWLFSSFSHKKFLLWYNFRISYDSIWNNIYMTSDLVRNSGILPSSWYHENMRKGGDQDNCVRRISSKLMKHLFSLGNDWHWFICTTSNWLTHVFSV